MKKSYKVVASVFFKILNDTSLCRQFIGLNSILDIYDFFKKVEPNAPYSDEEFHSFFNCIFDLYEKELAGRSFDDVMSEILGQEKYENIRRQKEEQVKNNEALKEISGGKGSMFKDLKSKLVALSLSGITLATTVAPTSNAFTYRRGKAVETSQSPEVKQSWFQRNKSLLKKIGIGVGVIAGVAVLAVGFKFIKDRLTKSSDEEKEDIKKRIVKEKELLKESEKNYDGAVERKRYVVGEKAEKLAALDSRTFETQDEKNKAINVIEEEYQSKFEKTNASCQSEMSLVNSHRSTVSGLEAKLKEKGPDASETLLNKIKSPFVQYGAPFLAVGSILSGAMTMVSSFSKNVQNISSLKWSLSSLKKTAEELSTSVISTKREMLPTNEAIRELDNVFESVIGQEQAKAQLRNIAAEIIIQKDMAEKSNTEPQGATLIFSVGSSGTGKTYTMDLIAPYISSSTLPTYKFSSGNINKESSKTIIEQIFGGVKQHWGNETAQANLVSEIKKDKNRIFIMDEYDKYSTPATDEVFRTAKDSGYIMTPEGEEVDCRGSIFVMTSNELGPLEMKDIKANLTPSRTLRNRDVSFTNRINWVYFKPHTAEEFVKMVVDHFTENTAKYWEREDVANFSLGIDSDCVDIICRWLVEQDRGARPLDNEILPTINGAVVAYMKEHGIDSMDSLNMKVIIDPTQIVKNEKDEFVLPEKTEATNIRFQIVSDHIGQSSGGSQADTEPSDDGEVPIDETERQPQEVEIDTEPFVGEDDEIPVDIPIIDETERQPQEVEIDTEPFVGEDDEIPVDIPVINETEKRSQKVEIDTEPFVGEDDEIPVDIPVIDETERVSEETDSGTAPSDETIDETIKEKEKSVNNEAMKLAEELKVDPDYADNLKETIDILVDEAERNIEIEKLHSNDDIDLNSKLKLEDETQR